MDDETFRERYPAAYLEDTEGRTYHSRADFLWNRMGGCLCGGSDPLMDAAWEIFQDCAQLNVEDRRFMWDTQTQLHLALSHWLNFLGLLEHGGMVEYSWLTDKGKQLLKEINSLVEVVE